MAAAGSSSSSLAKYKLVFLGDQARSPRLLRSRWRESSMQAGSFRPSLASEAQVSRATAQSVGKTSIITRFVYDKFDCSYQARRRRRANAERLPRPVYPRSTAGDDRHRLPVKDDVLGRPHREAAALVR